MESGPEEIRRLVLAEGVPSEDHNGRGNGRHRSIIAENFHRDRLMLSEFASGCRAGWGLSAAFIRLRLLSRSHSSSLTPTPTLVGSTVLSWSNHLTLDGLATAIHAELPCVYNGEESLSLGVRHVQENSSVRVTAVSLVLASPPYSRLHAERLHQWRK